MLIKISGPNYYIIFVWGRNYKNHNGLLFHSKKRLKKSRNILISCLMIPVEFNVYLILKKTNRNRKRRSVARTPITANCN